MNRRFVSISVSAIAAGLLVAACSETLVASSPAATQIPATTQNSGAPVQSGQGQGQTQGQGQSQSQGQAQNQAARPVFGSVTAVSGDTLSVKTQQGSTTEVNIAGVRIEKTVSGTAADLKAGETVVVLGQQGSDGVVSATSVQIRPANTPTGRTNQNSGSQSNP